MICKHLIASSSAIRWLRPWLRQRLVLSGHTQYCPIQRGLADNSGAIYFFRTPREGIRSGPSDLVDNVNVIGRISQCYIYASLNWVSIGSGNGLSPLRRQAIAWTNDDKLSIGPIGQDFNEIGWANILIPIGAFWLKFHWSLFLKDSTDNKSTPVTIQVMACHRTGDKPLSKPLMA